MPQMSPINWLTLFMMFIMIFMMFNSLNYFMFLYPPKSLKFKKIKTSLNWKW